MRQTGTTTHQMLSAPHRAVYVWPNQYLSYPRDLARSLVRHDLVIVSPSWLEDDRCRGVTAQIILDHATHLTNHQHHNWMVHNLRDRDPIVDPNDDQGDTDFPLSHQPTEPTMNLSTTVFLVDRNVRSVRIEYDPDTNRNNNPNKFFKTLDPDLKKDDMVVVPTSTRHGFTVCKVVEVDFPVNFDAYDQWAWIVGKVDTTTYDQILEKEKGLLSQVAKIEENKKRKELADAMSLAEVGDITFALPKPVNMHGETAAPLVEPPPAPAE